MLFKNRPLARPSIFLTWINRCDINFLVRPTLAAVLFAFLLPLFCLSSAAAERLAAADLEIPPGKWKSIRLKDLPKDANIAVHVASSGEILVVFLNSTNYRRFSEAPRPLFSGRAEKQLSFSFSIPEKGDYYVVLDNRTGQEPRAVKVTVRAARAGAGQKKSAEEILVNFERQLLRLFVFKPFPIGARKCGAPRPFAGDSGIILCEEYVHHLYDALKDKGTTRSVLSFSIFYEVSRQLLGQWHHPSAGDPEVIDEFTAVLMAMLNLRDRLIATAEHFLGNPSSAENLSELFGEGPHPPSAQRAKKLLALAKDVELPRRWQKSLVPHMQTALLKRLQKQPTSWTDLPLVEKELAKRSNTKKITI
jgi:hypothetical protein